MGLSSYVKDLKDHGGKYDIVVLSSGEEGHVGALYPGHHSISDESEFYIKMNDSPKPPPNRMTSSRKLLKSAKYFMILLFGIFDAKQFIYFQF